MDRDLGPAALGLGLTAPSLTLLGLRQDQGLGLVLALALTTPNEAFSPFSVRTEPQRPLILGLWPRGGSLQSAATYALVAGLAHAPAKAGLHSSSMLASIIMYPLS